MRTRGTDARRAPRSVAASSPSASLRDSVIGFVGDHEPGGAKLADLGEHAVKLAFAARVHKFKLQLQRVCSRFMLPTVASALRGLVGLASSAKVEAAGSNS